MALTLHGTVSDNTVALDRKTATPLIINGDMQIAQRGTSATGITGSQYLVDRFKFLISGLGTWTISQATDTPTGQGFNKSFKLDCTTADASPASTDNLSIIQRFEGQNLQMLKKGTSDAESLTVSFWVKSAKTGTYILELHDQDNSRHICKAYTISSANTWEKKVLSFAGDTTGALDNDNASSFQVRWWLGTGSDYSSGTLPTSWSSLTTANRAVGNVNLADSTSNDWYITGVQLEVGTFDANSIPPFQFEDRGTSLLRCQRYYQRIQGDTGDDKAIITGMARSTSECRAFIPLITTMRAEPSFAESDMQILHGFSTITPVSLNTTLDEGINSFGITVTADSGTPFTAGHGVLFRLDNIADSFVEFDAEL